VTIDELLARGHLAYLAALARRYLPGQLPLGTEGLAVVTAADHDAYPALCRAFAKTRSLYILNEVGATEFLLSKVPTR